MNHRTIRRSCLVLIAGAALLGLGCSSSGTPATPANINKAQRDLDWIADAYAQVTDSTGKPPLSAKDLEPVLKLHGDPASILKSPNDNQPYEIVYGLKLNDLIGELPVPIIAYERKGANGKRWTVDADKNVVVMTDEEFSKAKFPKGHTPPK